MLDRWGQKIRIGWSDVEIIYICAALSLPRQERREAFEQIADLTGRTLAAVQERAYNLQAARLRPSEPRGVVVAARSVPCPQRAPGAIRPLSRAALMDGRAATHRNTAP
jgi:hypothetical protein